MCVCIRVCVHPCLCMHAFVHICLFACMPVHMYVCAHNTYIAMCISACVCMCVHVCVHMHVCLHVSVYACACPCVCLCVHGQKAAGSGVDSHNRKTTKRKDLWQMNNNIVEVNPVGDIKLISHKSLFVINLRGIFQLQH